MNVKKVRHIADIPEWFDLENYSATASFSPSEWHKQIYHRQKIQHFLRTAEGKLNPKVVSMFENLKENPLKKVKLKPSERGGLASTDGVFVEPLTCDFVQVFNLDIEQHYRPNKNKDLNLGRGYSVSQFYRDNNYHLAPLEPLVINLDGSDAEIKSEFDLYLRQARELSGIQSEKLHITQAHIDRFERFNILPYFDLLIWEAVEKRKITASILVEALFMENDAAMNRGETFITESVKPFYEKIDRRFMMALHSYANTNQ